MKNKIALIFLLSTLYIDVNGESNQTFVESFTKCVDRIEGYRCGEKNEVTYREFCYSLDSIARYGIVNYTSMMNYWGPSGGLPDLHQQMSIWLQWCQANKETQTWAELPSTLSKDGSHALYSKVFCWIRDNLSNTADYYSEISIDSLGNEKEVRDVIYVKELKGITDSCGVISGEKKFVTINTLYGVVGDEAKHIHYYQISPAMQDKYGNIYLVVGDVMKDVVPIEYKKMEPDPIDRDYGDFHDIYKIVFEIREGSPSLSKWEKLGTRLSFRH